MHITLSPVRRDDRLALSRSGDVLIINGEALDLAFVPEGGRVPRDEIACPWLASDVQRIEGVLHLALILPHGPSAPEETRFPDPLEVTGDGPVNLPPYESPT